MSAAINTKDSVHFGLGDELGIHNLYAQTHLSDAQAHVDRMLRQIRSAHQTGMRKKADHLTAVYLKSHDARYLATITAFRKMKRHRRPSAKLLPGIAERLSPWDGTDETVVFRLKEKENKLNEFRQILDFGIENRALQYLVRPVLAARADLHPNQYLLTGVHAAIKRVAELLAAGYVWAIETDIKDCYTSFDREKVDSLLPLPRRVTRNCLLGVSLNLSVSSDISFNDSHNGPSWQTISEADEFVFASELADARRGFPQGSAASPLAVEMLLAPLFAQLPEGGGATIGYADNFLTMGPTKGDVVSMKEAFWSALKAHPAGRLLPNPPKVFKPGQSIEFLGHEMRRHNGKVEILPSPRNIMLVQEKLRAGLHTIETSRGAPARAARMAGRLRRYVQSWMSAFKLCDDIGQHRARALKRIDATLAVKRSGAPIETITD